MGKRFSHEGSVTVKDGESWRKLGEVVVWIQFYPEIVKEMAVKQKKKEDEIEVELLDMIKSVSGVSTVDGAKTNFRAWNVKDRR